MKLEILYLLETILLERRRLKPANSYASYLFARGLPKLLDKLGEETVELVVATRHRTKKDIVNEAADVLFHLLAFMVFMRIDLDDILPGQGQFTDAQIEDAINDRDDDKENLFFFSGAMDSVAHLVILSSNYDGLHPSYKKVSKICRQLFYCILLLCNYRNVRLRQVLIELKMRMKEINDQDKELHITH